jgi:hypothetical protein
MSIEGEEFIMPGLIFAEWMTFMRYITQEPETCRYHELVETC